jgi:hypothetical protein
LGLVIYFIATKSFLLLLCVLVGCLLSLLSHTSGQPFWTIGGFIP